MRFDAHVHVFHTGLPLRAHRRYAPARSARPQDLLAQLDEQGVRGAVLVQPSFLAEHGFVLRAGAEHPDRFRVVTAPASLAELHDGWDLWQEHGVVGVRLNLVGRDLPDLTAREWVAVGRELAAAHLHLEVHASGRQWERLVPALLDWPSDVVVDHLGRTGDTDTMLRLGERAHVWFKVSAPYRWPDPDAAGSLVRSLLASTGGERLLWGSDWPFTQHEREVDYAGMVAAVQERFPLVARSADANLERLLGPRRFDVG